MQAKIILIALVLGLVLVPCAISAKPVDDDVEKIADEIMGNVPRPARWQIYFSPHLRADTYLLDTQTGQCFLGVTDKDGSNVWARMAKLD